jgi:Ser/Thr protein kinase RdoA (MazF antagonist)
VIEIARAALPLWGLEGSHVELAAARENQVYRVDSDSKSYALRLHRSGYRTDEELRSELVWMAAVAKHGTKVPEPLLSKAKVYLHDVGGFQVDVLSWLNGSTFRQAVDTWPTEKLLPVYSSLGQEMAKFHAGMDAWSVPADFKRWSWDRKGLLGETPVWGRFWENPTLNYDDRILLEAFRAKANADLKSLESGLDYGLIHADLLSDNVMLDGDVIQFIDFDDGGYGFRLFDLVTALVKLIDWSGYEMLKTALLDGYQKVRAIDLSAFDLVMALRCVTYVGWIADRLEEPGALERNAKNIAAARQLVAAYLGS